uniref:Uncharacterized protein n=1 Tax=Oryza rufipogon TaxID=4529 RepID=A0A0E0MUN2_ORYRU
MSSENRARGTIILKVTESTPPNRGELAVGVHTNAGTCPYQEALSKKKKKKKKKHMKNASPCISMDTRIKKLAMRPIIGNVSFRQQNSLAVNQELNGINELEVEKNST